jgi:hypothetical protein
MSTSTSEKVAYTEYKIEDKELKDLIFKLSARERSIV